MSAHLAPGSWWPPESPGTPSPGPSPSRRCPPRRTPWLSQSDLETPGWKLKQTWGGQKCKDSLQVLRSVFLKNWSKGGTTFILTIHRYRMENFVLISPMTNASVEAMAMVRTMKKMATALQLPEQLPLRSLEKFAKPWACGSLPPPALTELRVLRLLWRVPDSCFSWVELLKGVKLQIRRPSFLCALRGQTWCYSGWY